MLDLAEPLRLLNICYGRQRRRKIALTVMVGVTSNGSITRPFGENGRRQPD